MRAKRRGTVFLLLAGVLIAGFISAKIAYASDVQLSPASITVTEGSGTSVLYGVRLTNNPGGGRVVIITISAAADGRLRVRPNAFGSWSTTCQLVFAHQWNTYQYVRVRANDDSLAQGTVTAAITHVVSASNSATYPVGTTLAPLVVTILDDDANQAPVLASLPDRSDPEGGVVSVDFSGYGSDPDGDPLSWSASGLPPGLAMNPSSGVVSGNLSYVSAGAYGTTVTISDGSLTDQQSFNWTVTDVNRNPAFTAAPANTAQNVLEGQGLAAVTAVDDPDETLTYALTGGTLPSGITLNGDGTFSGTAGFVSAGAYSPVITVSDGKGGSASTTVAVTVTDVNRNPAFTAAPANTAQSVLEGQGLTAVTAGDDPDETLTYALTGGTLPSGITLNGDGTFSGTAGFVSAGAYSPVITVSDGKGGSASTTVAVTVTDVNRNPAFTGDPANTAQSVLEGQGLAAVTAVDDPDETLTYALTGGTLPSGITLNGDGTFSGTAGFVSAGAYSPVITVSDGKGGSASTTVAVTVTDVNRNPAFTGDPTNTAQSVLEGQGLAAVTAVDDPDETLTYALTGGTLPSGITLNGDGTFSGTAGFVSAGAYSPVITVSDGKGGSASTTVAVTVTDVNRNPAFTGDPTNTAQSVLEGQGLAAVTAVDDPDETLTYALTGGTLPSGITLNGNGTFSGTAAELSAGLHRANITVSDGKGGSASTILAVTVDYGGPSVRHQFDPSVGTTIDAGLFALDVPAGAIKAKPGSYVVIYITPVWGDWLLSSARLPAGFEPLGRCFQFRAVLYENGVGRDITTFDEPLIFHIRLVPYELARVKDPARVGLFRLNVYGGITSVGGRMEGDTLVVQMSGFSLYVLAQTDPRLPDLTGSWSRTDLELMALAGMLWDTDDGEFDPGAAVTRAQFVAMLVRTMGLPGGYGAVPFSDVAESHRYYSELTAAFREGLALGFGDGTFRPNNPISREQAAVILSRALLVSGKVGGGLTQAQAQAILERFVDAEEVAPTSVPGVGLAVREGIVAGRRPGVLAPREAATGFEASLMVLRYYYHGME